MGGLFRGYAIRGLKSSPSPTASGDILVSLGGGGFTNASKDDAGSIRIVAGSNWSSTNAETRIVFSTTQSNTPSPTERLRIESNGNVGIGTTNPQYKLAVNGNIGAQDIIVTNTGWSDYVFRPGYRLRPLSEVSQFIQKNGHLPDIPTEAEVKEKGVSVAEMQAKLLAKIEELTLHMIQAEKENRDLRERLARVESQTAR
jgi:hypothetical protein